MRIRIARFRARVQRGRENTLTVKPAGETPIKAGILGLANSGIAIWDKANVEARLTLPGLVEQAAGWVPRLRAAGADVVIVAA